MQMHLVALLIAITSLLTIPTSVLSATPTDPLYSAQWGVDLVMKNPAGPERVWDIPNADGSGITIYVIDSGVSPHGDLSFLDAGGDSDPAAIGHGTGVYGILAANHNGVGIAGMVPGANVVSRKTPIAFNNTVTALNNLVAEATPPNYIVQLSRAYPPNPIAINMMCPVVNDVINNGGFVVAGAGNILGVNPGVQVPAACNDSGLVTVANRQRILSVGNSQVGDVHNPSSSYSPDHDVFAPGTNIHSTTKAGGYTDFTGTSFSAPIVSGAAAILMGCGVSPANIETVLEASGPAIAFPGGNAPRINVYTALANNNQTPTAVVSDYTALIENTDTTGGITVANLNVNDTDICDQHQYEILPVNDYQKFTLGGANNQQLILDDGVLDYEKQQQYHITLRVMDFFGATVDQQLVMPINNVNEAPQIVAQNFSIDENSPQNTIVGIVQASDPDAGDSVSYTIVAGNSQNAFDIGPVNGQLWVNNSAALDYENQTVLILTIEVSDMSGLKNTATITVNINNLDDMVITPTPEPDPEPNPTPSPASEPVPQTPAEEPAEEEESGGGFMGVWELVYYLMLLFYSALFRCGKDNHCHCEAR